MMSQQADDGVILCVGLVVVDIVTVMDRFPQEDIKTRAECIYEEVGGNATTNCRILSILGEKASFMGCVGTATHLQLVLDVFKKYGIDHSAKILWDGHPMPVSVCLINKLLGTRTCLHYRGSIPELLYDDFIKADLKLTSYKWIHFEGRYEYHDTSRQIRYLHGLKVEHKYKYKISVELEKANEALYPLLDSEADYLFVSKDFSKFSGYADMHSAVRGLCSRVRSGVVVVCPWGSEGASAMLSGTNQVYQSPSFPPESVVSTLGAGDTFIAACIKALSNNLGLQEALTFACKVAGAKCGLSDFDELKSFQF